LTNSQVNDLSVSYPSHLVHGVSGFSNDEVLSGGCAIFWSSSLALTPVKVDTCSRRICAILLEAKNVRLLCVCVYLPYEKANENTDEFLFQMSVIDSIISQFPDCHVIVGGDFNIDFSRQSLQSHVLKDFCVRSNLHPVRDHSKSSIDYTYNFNMTSFSVIDHILLSEQLFNTSVSYVSILHECDDTSDHDPVCLHLDVSVVKLKCDTRVFTVRPSWDKANALHIEQYKKSLAG